MDDQPRDSNLNTNDDDGDEYANLFKELIEFRNNHQSNFIYAHVNINSYRHKFPYVNDILKKNCFDYFAISETKLDESFPSAQFSIEGYQIFRQDFTSTSRGIVVYIRSDLAHRRLTNIEYNADGIDSVCLEITIGKSKTVFICVYKHPKVKNDFFKQKLGEICDKILQLNSDFVILGDLNCDPKKTNIIDFICDTYCLTNLVKSPTCYKGPVHSLIDVILVSSSRKYSKALNTNCPLSDFHNIIGAATKRFAPVMKPRNITYRSYKNFDDDKFKYDLSIAPFHVAEIFDDIDDTAWFTSQLLSNIIDEHAPLKTKTIKKESVPYMNSSMRKALYKRNMARNKFRKFGKQYWEDNRRKRNEMVAIRNKSLQNYFSKNCSKPDKSFWSTISPFMSNKKLKSSGSITLQENDKTENDNETVANIFNPIPELRKTYVSGIMGSSVPKCII